MPTLEQEILQAQSDAVMQRILLDDRRRHIVREISGLRRVLLPILTRLPHLEVTNMLDWSPESRAQYHVESRELQKEVNTLRERLERLYLQLPKGYTEKFIEVPLAAEISIRVLL